MTSLPSAHYMYVGDWHILHNYQKVLMKVFFDVGLKDLAKASGFRGETLTALHNASNFHITHQFLTEVWEALYQHMLTTFIQTITPGVCPPPPPTYFVYTPNTLTKGYFFAESSLRSVLASFQEENGIPSANLKETPELDRLLQNFHEFVEKMGDTDPNWKFWGQFVRSDLFAYIALYTAVR